VCKTAQWGIRLSVIDDEVDEDSTEEEDDNERNKTDHETANNNENKEASIVSSGFSMPSPHTNC
jgi:hypothetical protein